MKRNNNEMSKQNNSQNDEHSEIWNPLFSLSPFFGKNWPTQELTLSKMDKSDWLPAVDVKEDDKKITVHADLPGIKKEDIKVKYEKNVLSIEGERKEEKEEKDTKYHRVERKYGKFSRSFKLPENVDHESLKAKFSEGVLDITINKKENKDQGAFHVNIE